VFVKLCRFGECHTPFYLQFELAQTSRFRTGL
jgi:hypothetical protein